MLFRDKFLKGIRDGTITVAFRCWHRPSVRTGGTLLTAVGQLSISSVAQINLSDISQRDARRAGYESLEALLEELQARDEGDIYRIDFGPLRADPRIALREAAKPSHDDRNETLKRLRRLDARSSDGPWVLQALQLIHSRPGVRAADLCGVMGQSIERFKPNIRKLKALGLTESLEVGYRLSPRGVVFMDALLAERSRPA
jgi:hypothetical protein